MPARSVSRGRLVEKAIGREPITVVCAPAGSGKTMATADWAATVRASGHGVAWLTVEDRDNRPYEFWSAVIEACLAAMSEDGAANFERLSPPRQAMEPGFVSALAELLVAEPSLRYLVLDDVHRLNQPQVLAGLDLFAAHACADLGMVMAGRIEPPISLPRWRLDGLVGDIGGADLAFTDNEAAELLASLDAGINLEAVSLLVSRTEGWAAGLRLAAVHLAAVDDPMTFLAEFEGDHRPVGDYLFSEIIQHLPQGVRDFLRATCAPEQLSTELAAHLSGWTDAGEVLDQLCRANALVVQSGETSWYRYHSLLRGYLLADLGRHDVAGPRRQHAETARWFDQHGEAATALDHAARSGDADLLRDLIHRTGLRLVLSGQAGMIQDTLGVPSAPFADDQRVAIVAALAALDVADVVAADEWLTIVQNLERTEDASLAAMRASATVQRALLGGEVPSALDESKILELKAIGDPDVDLIMFAYRAPGRMRTGDYRGAIADLEHALELAEARGYDQFVLYSLSQLAGMSGTLCDFRASFEWSHRAIEFAIPRGWADSPRLAYAYLIAAWTAFQTGDVPAQTVFASRGLRALSGVDNVEVEMGVRSMHALASFEAASGRGRHDAAEAFHRLWQGPASDEVSPALNSLATQQEVRLALAVGRADWAREAIARLRRQLPGSAESVTLQASLRAARGQLREALTLIAPVLRGETPPHMTTTGVVTHILAACLETALDHQQRAFDAVQTALEWAAKNNYKRPFLDAWHELEPLLIHNQGRFGAADGFVAELIENHRASPQVTDGLVNQAFTDREFDVLRELPSVLTAQEIAEAQGVSLNTVKTHIRAIYRKLGVGSRGEAVREARARGML